MKAFLFFLLGASSLATAQDDVSRRIAEYEHCLKESAMMLDDKTSPALQVARIVALECTSEWDGFLRTTADRSPARRAKLMAEYPSQISLDMATKAVLMARQSTK